MMKKRSNWQKASKMILTFICSLSLFAVLSVSVIQITLFNQAFMIHVAESSNYAETITKEINHAISDLGRSGNIPPKVLSHIISKTWVKENNREYIYSIYHDTTFQIKNTKQIEESIQNKVEEYVREKNVPINEEIKKTISKLKEAGIKSAQRYIEIPYFALYVKKIIGYRKTLQIIFIFASMLSIILFFAIASFNRFFSHLNIRYLAYMIGGAGWMIGALPAYLYSTHMIKRLGIHSEALYQFLTTYLNNFLLMFIKYGIYSILFSLFLFFISECFRKKLLQRRK
ncbi:hypothetical protein [Enterococcus ratti]|uniref:Uncharacterized protein n=1 Tax=Enterococcus ratti TaxID=150033 RepID=A0A1L8WIJ2_9ENTE|nr:hypothetical protein [Enterococcus ratti]OJG80844.1 hypothetical protein RV14_GL000388 [Enterococcus ratti]